jgi:hypothetical protein
LVVTPVNGDRLPMVPPGGYASFGVIAWTIQPTGTRFDPPIRVQIPNTAGLKPGETLPIVQWDHDLATFVPMGRGTVSEDGTRIVSDEGAGITKAGWGGGPPPVPPNCGSNPPPGCRGGQCAECPACESKQIAPGQQCPACRMDPAISVCDDKEPCTADDNCVLGKCLGTKVEVTIKAASKTICVGNSKVFSAQTKPPNRTVQWFWSGGVTATQSGVVTAVSTGEATVRAQDPQCNRAFDRKYVRVIDDRSSDGESGETWTCMGSYLFKCRRAREYQYQIDPPTDQGVPTWVSTNFRSNNAPGECRANREGSEMDAATHAYLSCMMHRDPNIGEAAADAILKAHEDEHPEDDCNSHEMDFNNNEVGKALSRDPGDCTDLVFDRLNRGDLQVRNPFPAGMCSWKGNGL